MEKIRSDFDLCFRKARPSLLRIARELISLTASDLTSLRDDAEDLVSQALLLAIQKRPDLPDLNVSTGNLERMIMPLMVRILGHRHDAVESMTTIPPFRIYGFEGFRVTPGCQEHAVELGEVFMVLQEESPDMRETFLLVMMGFSKEEASELMCVHPNTIGSRVSRIRSILRYAFGPIECYSGQYV